MAQNQNQTIEVVNGLKMVEVNSNCQEVNRVMPLRRH